MLEVFEVLISCGYIIIIIEYNMDVIKCVDYVIDLGFEGGNMGGNLVVVGILEEVVVCVVFYMG